MRRIYESDALYRDDDEPGAPRERQREERPQAFRSVPTGSLSRWLVPDRVRYWGLSLDIATPRTEFRVGEHVPFQVTMKNSLPFPVTIATRSPLLWTWHVDDHQEASKLPASGPPEEERGFRFERGERKQFRKRWDGMFKIADAEWERAAPGEYTIGAGLNVDGAAEKGLYSETTVTLRPE
ncbi:MAG: hypothetical protein V5A55_06820 [Halovenus sp.]